MKKLHIICALVVCFAAMYVFTGCGVSHSSPEGVVKSMVKYSEKGKENKVLECYGLDKTADDDTKKEVESMIAYFKAMKSKGITLVDCDVIKEYSEYSYVYISYEVELSKDKSYPKVDTYFVTKASGKYCVVPTKDVSDTMSKSAEEEYATFMNSDTYKNYQRSYDAFMLKNPSFEEELTLKLK